MTFKTLLAGAAVCAMATTAHAADLQALADEVNANLEAAGADYRMEYAELLVTADGDPASVFRFFNDRGNKQLTAHFVPGDTRRAWSGPGATSITWTSDNQYTLDTSSANQDAAFANAMSTWDAQRCSDFGLAGGAVNINTGVAAGPGVLTADVMHSGFLPAGVLGPNTLGITITFIFINPATGVPTDINNDGLLDTAFRDIYYNDRFTWGDGAGGTIDIQTVAFHEAGHGLSQAHFGTAFLDSGGGNLHFAPRAVMNAVYSGVQRETTGTDRGGHCSVWAEWPNN